MILRASFIRDLAEAVDALQQLAASFPATYTDDERIAVLQAVNRQALTIIVLVNEVLNTPRREG